MSQFDFLAGEFRELHEPACQAEATAHSDPRSSVVHSRLALEALLKRLSRSVLNNQRLAEQSILDILSHSEIAGLLGPGLGRKANSVRVAGNQAAHEVGAVLVHDALETLAGLFELSYWIARNYALGKQPDAGLIFDPKKVEKKVPVSVSTIVHFQKLKGALDGEAELRRKAEAERRMEASRRLAIEAEFSKLREGVKSLSKHQIEMLQSGTLGPLSSFLMSFVGASAATRSANPLSSDRQAWEVFLPPASLGSADPEISGLSARVFVLAPPTDFIRITGRPRVEVLVDGTPPVPVAGFTEDGGMIHLYVQCAPVLGAICITLDDGTIVVNLRTEPLPEEAGARFGDPEGGPDEG
jgi:hypothetical protein